jgi:hypothetical protein
VLQGTEGDDEPGIVGRERPRLKVGVDGLDAIGLAGRSGVLDEARQGALGMRSTAVTRDPVGRPATIGRVCRPTPAPRSYAWTGCVTRPRLSMTSECGCASQLPRVPRLVLL